MSRTDSLSNRLETYLTAASITAHACYLGTGFRQRDLKFYADLFLDWAGTPFGDQQPSIHNTQILRFLDSQLAEGLVKKSTREKQPRYKLTRVGLIESIRNLTERKRYQEFDELLFVCFFVANYSNKIIELIKQEGLEFPSSMQQEIKQLLDEQSLIKRQTRNIENYLAILRERIQSNRLACQKAEKLHREGREMSEIALLLEKQHPYNLNSQKPLSKLINEIPAELRFQELTVGARNRENYIWQKQLEGYQHLLKQLHSLLK